MPGLGLRYSSPGVWLSGCEAGRVAHHWYLAQLCLTVLDRQSRWLPCWHPWRSPVEGVLR